MSLVVFSQIFAVLLFGSLLMLNAINLFLEFTGRREQARRFRESVYPYVSYLGLPSK